MMLIHPVDRACTSDFWLTSHGRVQNEYISIMEKCKSKKLLWRVNKSYARELLPKEPLPVQLLPWHLMQVVNMGAHAGAHKLRHLCHLRCYARRTPACRDDKC